MVTQHDFLTAFQTATFSLLPAKTNMGLPRSITSIAQSLAATDNFQNPNPNTDNGVQTLAPFANSITIKSPPPSTLSLFVGSSSFTGKAVRISRNCSNNVDPEKSGQASGNSRRRKILPPKVFAKILVRLLLRPTWPHGKGCHICSRHESDTGWHGRQCRFFFPKLWQLLFST